VPEGKTPKCTYWGWPEVWPNWTWPGYEDEVFQVDVYAACDKVELFLNDESLGVKPTTREEKFMATFEVPYQPGALKAIGYIDGEPVTPYQIETVDAPAKLRLTPDRDTLKAEAGDLSFITVEVVDQAGRVHPHADHEVFFTVQGPGTIAAVGNGNPVSTERYRGNQRRAYRGRCLVVVKSNGESGEIHLRAHADGLDVAEVVIQVA